MSTRPYDFLASLPRSSPNRAEVVLAQEHRLLAQVATLNLKDEIQAWAIRHAARIEPEALADLYETLGLRNVWT